MGKKKAGLYQKRGIYYAQWFVNGRKFQKSTRTKDREKAEKIARKLYSASVVDTSVENIAARWIYENEFEKSKRYIKDVGIHTKAFSDWLFKKHNHRDAQMVERRTLSQYKLYQSRTLKWSSTSSAISFRTIKAVFRWAFKHDLLTNRPFELFDMPKTKRREAIITATDLKRILDVAKDDDYLNYLYIKFAALSGCRAGEINNLKWIDIKAPYISLNGKTGERKINLDPKINQVITEIRRLHDNKTWMLCNRDGVYIGKHYILSRIFKSYVRKLGLSEEYTLHTIRHSKISYHLADGVNAYTVKKIAGHANLSTTEGYDHLGSYDSPDPEWWVTDKF